MSSTPCPASPPPACPSHCSTPVTQRCPTRPPTTTGGSAHWVTTCHPACTACSSTPRRTSPPGRRRVLPGGHDHLRDHRRRSQVSRSAAAVAVRLFHLSRELSRVGHRPWQEPVRQGREPRGADLPRHTPSRDPRRERIDLSAWRFQCRTPRRRPVRRVAHRHPEADGVRVRQGEGPDVDRGVRPGAGPALRARRRAGAGRPHRTRRIRLGACGCRRRRARPHLHPQGPGGAHRRDHGVRRRRWSRRMGGRRPQGPGDPEVDGFGVRGLPERPVHDPRAHPRSGDGDFVGGAVAVPTPLRRDRRLGTRCTPG